MAAKYKDFRKRALNISYFDFWRVIFLRRLEQGFLNCLQEGHLSPLIDRVTEDKDLDLQIRDNYINIYYKGNSLLKLGPTKGLKYKPIINSKFTFGLSLPEELHDTVSTQQFIDLIPWLKENIQKYGKSSLEIEYEQLLIRANNLELKNNSEYFIIDRQYTTEARDRFDLTGFFWDRDGRKRGQTVPLCFFELKFALNSDLKEVHDQIQRYYNHIANNSKNFAQECHQVFNQKVSLGLLNQPRDRMDALQTLNFSENVEDYKFILVLIDYNPNSTLFGLDKLKQLPFASQISIFEAGLTIVEAECERYTITKYVLGIDAAWTARNPSEITLVRWK